MNKPLLFSLNLLKIKQDSDQLFSKVTPIGTDIMVGKLKNLLNRNLHELFLFTRYLYFT